MSPQNTIYLLAFLGWFSIVLTRFLNRDTIALEWIKENYGGLSLSFLAVVTTVLVGPDTGADLDTYLAKSWAAGIGGTLGYLISGNIRSKRTRVRKAGMRAAEAEVHKAPL